LNLSRRLCKVRSLAILTLATNQAAGAAKFRFVREADVHSARGEWRLRPRCGH